MHCKLLTLRLVYYKSTKGIACTDAVQAIGKIDFKFNEMQPQALFLASHKVCGPKGVGVLFITRGFN